MTKDGTYQHDFFDTTSVTDFKLKSTGRTPRGYPSSRVEDAYSPVPFAWDYDARRRAFIRHCLKNPAGDGIKGYYPELLRIREGRGPLHEGVILGALDYIDARYDCADFVLLGIMRMMYQPGDGSLITKKILRKAGETILNFKYWPDEPGIDSMCTWTENHQIMFSCNEYLAGRLYPDGVFTNSGMTGFEKMKKSRPRIEKWLDLRFRTGFSEWLSHIYYDEDITALLNLADFSGDAVISRQAAMVLDLVFLDMALNSLRGCFSSTHGRSYTAEKQNALLESTTDTSKLLFGTGIFSGRDNMSAVTLALSDTYRLPRVIFDIAADRRTAVDNRQRMGIKLGEAGKWGLDPRDPDDAMTLLSLEAYAHPRTFRTVLRLFDRFRWWDNQFFSPFKKMKGLITFMKIAGLTAAVTRLFEKDLCRNTREEVNIRTYRTPYYMLSSAQDYRAGYGGDQQHLWQATLSHDAICFTTHPGHGEDTSGGYWIGSGTLPRIGQVQNVLVAVYRVSRMPGIYQTNRLFFTHAWFPRDGFDEVREAGGWIFGRKRNGYLALRSQNGYRWQNEGKYAGKEIIAEGTRNIWICETGSAAEWGGFESFVDAIASSAVKTKGLSVRYNSPSRGLIAFGWRGQLRHNGTSVAMRDYPRYGNDFSDSPFGGDEISVSRGKENLRLNIATGMRDASGFV